MRFLAALENIHFGLRRRVVLAAALVGVLTALSTLAFVVLIESSSWLIQAGVMGVVHPAPGGEQLPFPRLAAPVVRRWLIVLLPAVGAAAGGWLVFRFAPQARGHSIDAVIRAFHERGGRIALHVPFVRAAAAIFTIGSGGSAGRIGPNAHIGAGIGSFLARRFGLTASEQRTLELAGCAGGIGAICRAPLGGALTAVEILYKDDFETSAIVPSVVCSLTAYAVYMWCLTHPLTGRHAATLHRYPPMYFRSAADLLPYLTVGLLTAICGRVFIWLFFGMRYRVFARVPGPRWVRCGIGGLLTGAMGLLCLRVLGGGLGYVQEVVDAPPADLAAAAAVLAAGALKMAATAATVGSGGSGGLFGPSLVIGALLGAGFGGMLHSVAPAWSSASIPACTVIGMAAFFSAVANAPIGAVVLVSEMMNSYSLLLPLILVSVAAFLMVRRRSVYEHQPEHRPEKAVGVDSP